jgi:ADP-heptose:LPS heptosyltransferase
MMKRVLIIQTAFLGDAILASSLVESLHQAFPLYQVDILVKKENVSLFSRHPFIKNVIPFDKKINRIVELFRLLRQIRTQKYDIVINIHRFFSSGLLTAFSGAKIRTGFSKNPMSFRFTHKYQHQLSGDHEINRNFQLISFLDLCQLRNPVLYIPEQDEQLVSVHKNEPYACIAPASVWFTKQYPADKWIEFLDSVPADLKVFFLGSKDDIPTCREIISRSIHRNSVILCGELSLLQSASLMKDAIMNYVNDSAPLHICSAVNAPVTAIFCSTVPSFGFGPLSSDSQIVETDEPLNCRPCGIHGHASCPEKHFQCAYSIHHLKLKDRLKLNPHTTYAD